MARELMRPLEICFLAAFVREQRDYFIDAIDRRLADQTADGRKKTVRSFADDILEESPPTTSIAGMKDFAKRLEMDVTDYYDNLNDEVKSMMNTLKRIDKILEVLEANDRPAIAMFFRDEAAGWRKAEERAKQVRVPGIDPAGQFARYAKVFETIAEEYEYRARLR